MARVRLASLMLLLVAACRTASPVPDRLDALFTNLHERGLFDGAVVVGRGTDVLWQKGYGYADAEARVPFTPDTPTDAASLAKTFTATLLLDLEREGRLRLDDPVQQYLPEFPYPDITLRHLLSHSSGLPAYYEFFETFIPADQVRTTEDLLRVLAREKPPLAFRPGTSFEYSSFAYDLAALAAARAAGEPFGTLLQKRYFAPLGITTAFLRPGRLGDFPGVRTRGYARDGANLKPNEVFDYEAFHGGSNIYISARDLQRWNAAFLGAPAIEFARIGVAPSMLTVANWYREGDAYWYSGHLQGFHSEVFRDVRAKTSIVYTSNNTLAPWLQKGIVRAVSAVLAGADVPPLQPPALVEAKDGEAFLATGSPTTARRSPLRATASVSPSSATA